MRQIGPRQEHPAPPRQPAGTDRLRRHSLCRQRIDRDRRGRDAEIAWLGDRNDLSGPGDLPQPRLLDRAAIDRRDPGASQGWQERGEGPRDRTAGPGPSAGTRPFARRLSAPALGRHAAARADCHGVVRQSAPADRRRADDGAGLHSTGPGARPDRRSGRRPVVDSDHDQPRSRRDRRDLSTGCGDLCWDDRRGRTHRAAVCRAGASLYRKAFAGDTGSRRRGRIFGNSGSIPNLVDPPSGCRFHPRCPLAEERCRAVKPELRALADGRRVACHLLPP